MMYDYEGQSWPNPACEEYGSNASPCQSVGMAYVPMQRWSRPMHLEEGFYKGTVFQDLDKPFLGRCL